jgi:hypothetical protein
MTDIALGQSIAGSTSTSNPTAVGGKFFDDYDIKGVDTFRQLKISSTRYQVQLINAATEAVVGSSNPTQTSLNWTTFPGINYKVRVLSNGAQDYTVSLGDGGKATSIVTSSSRNEANAELQIQPLLPQLLLLQPLLRPFRLLLQTPSVVNPKH